MKNDELEQLQKKGLLPFDLRNHRTKLIKLMKKVQEYGVSHNLHNTKRYIFSGSWMEQVDDVTSLMASVHDTNSSETALKLFNVICPYDKPLPELDEEEDALREFYQGKDSKEYKKSLLSQNPEAVKERKAARGMDELMKIGQSAAGKEETKEFLGTNMDSEDFKDLQGIVKATEEKLESANKEIDELKLTIEEREEVIEQLREQLNQDTAVAEDVQQENKKQTEIINKLNKELKDAQDQIEEVKGQLSKNKKEYQKLVKDIPEVKELEAIRKSMQNNERQRELDGQRDKALRFRSGLLFQRALDKVSKTSTKTDKPKTKPKDPVKSGDYYLTDDRALIRFLNTVERNEKSLYQRLLDADVEKTGTLRKSQFTEMLNSLHITPQDVMSLQRIAGFSSGRKEIQIDEFITVIKDRGKIRQKVEDDTFRKVQKSIRKQGWTLHETFQMFDIDRNNKVDFQEMVNGFKKLKIHVPNKHLKSIFAILDEDNNGSISLKEFKKKLEAYDTKHTQNEDLEKDLEREMEDDGFDQYNEDLPDEEEEYRRQEELKKQKEEEDKQKSLVTDKDMKDFKDTLHKSKQPEKSDVERKRQVDEIKNKFDQEEKAEYAKTLINGQLKVQVGKGYKLTNLQPEGYKYFYIVFYLEGTNENESFTSKPIAFYTKKSFNWSAVIPMVESHPDDFGDEFHIKLYASKGEFENADFYGEVYCKWKPTLEKPNEYAVANKFELTDQHNQSNIGKVKGRILVSAKFITAGDDKSHFTAEGKAKEELKVEKEKGTKKVQKGPLSKMGDLKVEIFRGKGFEPGLRHKLILRLESSKNKENTQTVKASERPDFDEVVQIPIYKRETEDVPNLIIQDIDPDEQDILSKLELNFSKIAYTKKQGIINTKWYAFEGSEDKVVQMQLTFTNVNYTPPVEKSKAEAEVIIDEDKAPTPKMTEFKFDDATIPDPKDTNKFADEFPSEESEEKVEEPVEEDPQSPEKPQEFNIGDAMADVSDGSGDFANL